VEGSSWRSQLYPEFAGLLGPALEKRQDWSAAHRRFFFVFDCFEFGVGALQPSMDWYSRALKVRLLLVFQDTERVFCSEHLMNATFSIGSAALLSRKG
jgi:hypothetical protein